MSHSEFSYYPTLENLTQKINDQALDPYDAYAYFFEAQMMQPESYLSTSITSGGHARDDSLGMSEVIAKNTESAKLLAEQLAIDEQIKPQATIEPVALGKTHWNQAEYMQFWLSTIGGVQLKKDFMVHGVDKLRNASRQLLDEHQVDLERLSSKLPAADRSAEYFKMAAAFADGVSRGDYDVRPVRQVVRMIDTDTSLGAQAERVFARQIGIKVMNICVMQQAGPENLTRINRKLAQDTARLISFGATIFDTQCNVTRLQLISDEP